MKVKPITVLVLGAIAITLISFTYPLTSTPFQSTRTVMSTTTQVATIPLTQGKAIYAPYLQSSTYTQTSSVVNANCANENFPGDYGICSPQYITTMRLQRTATTLIPYTATSYSTSLATFTSESTYSAVQVQTFFQNNTSAYLLIILVVATITILAATSLHLGRTRTETNPPAFSLGVEDGRTLLR